MLLMIQKVCDKPPFPQHPHFLRTAYDKNLCITPFKSSARENFYKPMISQIYTHDFRAKPVCHYLMIKTSRSLKC